MAKNVLHKKKIMYSKKEKRAIKFLEETDTTQFSMMELLVMFAEKEKALQLKKTGLRVSTNKNLVDSQNCPYRASGFCTA